MRLSVNPVIFRARYDVNLSFVISCLILLLLGVLAAGCDSSSNLPEDGPGIIDDEPDENDDDIPTYRMEESGSVALSVAYSDGARRVLLAPFENPSNVSVISPAPGYYDGHRLSPSGNKILLVTHANTQFTGELHLKNLKTGDIEPLRYTGPLHPDPETLVWDGDERGVFYSQRASISGTPSLWYYSFESDTANRINDDPILVSDIVGPDTLVGSVYAESSSFLSPIYIGTGGQDVSPFIIEGVDTTPGPTSPGVRTVDWNPVRKLYALEIVLSNGIGIAICDENRRNFRWVAQPTSSVHYTLPRWGPNGQLLMIRSLRGSDDTGQAWVYSTDDGLLRAYLPPGAIPGATGILQIDWNESSN